MKFNLSFCCLFVLLILNQILNAQNNRNWISISSENDFLGLAVTTDRYYSYGERVDYLKRLSTKDSSQQFLNVRFRLEGHTPKHKGRLELDKFRRPFFGRFHGNVMLLKSTSKYYFKYGLDLGITGPLAMAGDYQNWYHEKLIDDRFVNGWENQTPNKVGVNIITDFKRKVTNRKKHTLRVGSEQSIGNIYTFISPSINYQFHSDAMGFYLPFNYANSYTSRFTFEAELAYRYEFHNATLQGEYFSRSEDYLEDEVIIRSILFASFGFRYTINHFSLYFNNSFNTKRIKRNDFHNYGILGFGWQW